MPSTNDYQIWTLTGLLQCVDRGNLEPTFESPLNQNEQEALLTKVLVGQHFGIVGVQDGKIVENGAEIAFLSACFFPQDGGPQVYYAFPDEISMTDEPEPSWIPFRALQDSIEMLKFQRALDVPDKEAITVASDTLSRRYREYALPVVRIEED